MWLLIIVLFLITFSSGQSVLWERSYDAGGTGDIACGVAVDYEQNVIVTGYKGSGTGNDSIITLKYNSRGDLIWARRFGAAKLTHGMAVAVDRKNDVVVAGYRQNGNSAFLIVKYDKNGVFKWSREYLHGTWDGACGVAIDNNYNIITTGWYYINDYWEPLTVKFDSSGNLIWAKTFPTGYASYTLRAKTDAFNNIYVAGFFYPIRPPGNCGFLTIKYDQNGNYRWDRTYTRLFQGGPEPFDGAYGLAVDKSNNPIVTGTLVFTNYDCVTIKYDSSGNRIWVRTYDSGDNNGGGGVTTDQFNNVIVVAANSATDVFKYNSGGTLLWQTSHTCYISMDVASDTLNDFYAVGDNGRDMYIVKFRGTGTGVGNEINSLLRHHNFSVSPNPSRGPISISFMLDQALLVNLRVHDGAGRVVAVIKEGPLNKGNWKFFWDGKDNQGRVLPSGVYYVTLESPGFRTYSKLILMR